MHTWEGWGMHGFWWLFGFAIIVIAIWLILRQIMLRTRNKHETKDSLMTFSRSGLPVVRSARRNMEKPAAH